MMTTRPLRQGLLLGAIVLCGSGIVPALADDSAQIGAIETRIRSLQGGSPDTDETIAMFSFRHLPFQ